VANIGKLFAVLSLDAGGFTRGLRGAETQLARTSRSIQGLGRGVAGIFAAVGAGLGVRELIELSDAATRSSTKLKLATTSSEEFVATQGRLRDVANETRAGFEDTVSLYQRLRVATRDLGTSNAEVIDLVEGLNAAMAVSGTTSAEAGAGLIQLAQGLASNRLQGDELRSVLENMPQLAQRLADALGVTVGQLRELGSEGRLTAKVLIPALQTALVGFTDQLEQTPTTIGQAFTVAKNGILESVEAFNQATGAADAVASAILAVGDFLAESGQELKRFSSTNSEELDVLRGAWATLGEIITETLGIPDPNWLEAFAQGSLASLRKIAAFLDSAEGGNFFSSRLETKLAELEARGIREARFQGVQSGSSSSLDRVPGAVPGLPPAVDKNAGKKASRAAARAAKADIKEQADALQGIDQVFADLAESQSRLDFGELATDIALGRTELEDFARAAARTPEELERIPALLDQWEEGFRKLSADEGMKEITAQVVELETQLAESDLTPFQQQANAAAREIAAIGEASGLSAEKIEEMQARGAVALAGLEAKSKAVAVNISGALAGSFQSTIQSLLAGTATIKSVLTDVGEGLVGAFTDAFAQIIQNKLEEFDPVLEDNFLTDIPGIVGAGAKFMGEAFMEFIDVAIEGVKDLISWLITAVDWQVILNTLKAVGGGVLGLIGLASGGIVTGPTPAIVGEAGPEAVIPLDRLEGMTRAPAERPLQVNIYNQNGSDVKTQKKRRGDGSDELRLFIKDTVSSDILRGGQISKSMDASRGLRQIGTER
jgi:tape measure domain-containing protein